MIGRAKVCFFFKFYFKKCLLLRYLESPNWKKVLISTVTLKSIIDWFLASIFQMRVLSKITWLTSILILESILPLDKLDLMLPVFADFLQSSSDVQFLGERWYSVIVNKLLKCSLNNFIFLCVFNRILYTIHYTMHSNRNPCSQSYNRWR